ncbi:hypothetical protein ACPOL_5091 [Acidisarcina polymorpha]|uniref:Uncharacterized protein n=1 Tax=Acidisarcina polymorpha TaxID=2211140 RepID=A0A2Z5G6D1_9BACT|nr:hypothetical protein [Acidisarcina polymorpha]AXC14347.1 hypothetical protein ACPOL_5091 [Acidisarcina polymorpha]
MIDQTGEGPLDEFKEKITEVLELLNKDNIPIIIADEGKIESVLQGPGSHVDALQALEHSETVEAVRRGLVEADAGQMRLLDEALRAVLSSTSKK